jgi:hypothetical protein
LQSNKRAGALCLPGIGACWLVVFMLFAGCDSAAMSGASVPDGAAVDAGDAGDRPGSRADAGSMQDAGGPGMDGGSGADGGLDTGVKVTMDSGSGTSDGGASDDAGPIDVDASPQQDAEGPDGGDGSSCTIAGDCVSAPDGRTVCHDLLGRCVQCQVASDCGELDDCIDFTCRPHTPCSNSLACSGGEVCDMERGRCVECLATPDCDDGESCSDQHCRLACDSDLDCTPSGLLCEHDAEHCVECLSSSDCPSERHCRAGRCALDECESDLSRCTEQGHGVIECAADGASAVVDDCAGRQTCEQATAGAQCRDWTCTPGYAECDGDELVQCSVDGFAVDDRTDCAATGDACLARGCRERYCDDGLDPFCSAGRGWQCWGYSVTTNASNELATCPPTTYCDVPTGACHAGTCRALEPACNGHLATTCNAAGTGYEAGGTDCTALGQVCSDGACQPVICTADALSCDGDAVTRCNSDGTRIFVNVCEPGQRCDNGECVSTSCARNSALCHGKELRRCNAEGTESVVQRICTDEEQCDARANACVLPGACDPLQCLSCSGLTPLTCCTTSGLCGCSPSASPVCFVP